MRWRIAGLFLLCAVPALAADGPECFSRYTKFNICAKAREIHSELAPILPMKLSANVTLTSAIVVGPVVALGGVWNLSQADLAERQRANNIDRGELKERMAAMTKNSVCSSKILGAYVRLGGKIIYSYKTLDGFTIAEIPIETCR